MYIYNTHLVYTYKYDVYIYIYNWVYIYIYTSLLYLDGGINLSEKY